MLTPLRHQPVEIHVSTTSYSKSPARLLSLYLRCMMPSHLRSASCPEQPWPRMGRVASR